MAGVLLLLLPLCLLLNSDRRDESPDRTPQADKLAAVRFEAVALPSIGDGSGEIAGAWRVGVDDPRFGGVSALALSNGGLVAVTDSGVAVDLPRPGSGATALLRDLPDGPGPERWKMYRDSESLAPSPRGWWVGFEFRHSLWLFDHGFERAIGSISPRRFGWPRNRGVEAIVADGNGLLLLPEGGRRVIHLGEGGIRSAPLEGAGGQIADAARAPDGSVLLLVRSVGLGGITNRVARLERTASAYRAERLLTLPLGRFDNAEAIAAEPLLSGATRLWIMTDNDFSSWRDTVLIALDLPAN